LLSYGRVESGCMENKLTTIELLVAEELAELIRFTPNQIIRMARRGEIPAINIFGKLRFDAREIERWLAAKRI
jgi:Helix-turn-helix domain